MKDPIRLNIINIILVFNTITYLVRKVTQRLSKVSETTETGTTITEST